MSSKSIILIILDLLIAIGLVAWILKSFKNFKHAIYYLLLPNIVSIIKKDYDNDFSYTHKLLFILVILFVIVLVEVNLFY